MCPEPNINGTLTPSGNLYGIIGVGGGTANYNNLINKPTINNVELSGNKTSSDLGIPTKTSDLTNDSGFITASSVPTKTSQLTNDSGYITSASLNAGNVSYSTSSSGVSTNNVQTVIDNIINAIRNALSLVNESGSVASFTTEFSQNLFSCVADINLSQAGTGDPSPSNPRAISGYSNVVISIKDGNDNTIKTVTAALGQTVYGGTIDVTTGLLTITHQIVDMGDYTWTYNSTRVAFNTTLTGIKLPSAAGVMSNLISDIYKTETAVSTGTQVTGKPDYSILQNTANATVFVKNSGYTNGNTFKTAMTGKKIVFLLDTPLQVQLTGNIVPALNGANNISADSGNIKVTYLKTVGGLLT